MSIELAINAVALSVSSPKVAVDIVIELAKKNPEVFAGLESIGEAWVNECRDLAKAGKKLDAIKLCRSFTGWSLKDAKEYCDKLGDKH